jgi:uncharacterized protein (TIGR02099 family)
MSLKGKSNIKEATWGARITWIAQGAYLMKKCWMPLASLIIVLAILFSLFRALTPWATQYKGEVEQHLSSLLGRPVLIHSMETSWYWFEPVLRLNQVSVLDKADKSIQLNKLLVGINLLSSLWHWHIEPGILYIDDVHLNIHQEKKGRWAIDGLSQNKPLPNMQAEAYAPVLSWLLAQQKIIIKNISAQVHLNDGRVLPFSGVNLSAVNHSGRYRLKAEAFLAQNTPTKLLLLADMKLNPYALSQVSGEAYVALQQLVPTQWQDFFPALPYHFKNGQGDFEVWLNLSKGQVSNVQTRFNLHGLTWNKGTVGKNRFIQSLAANVAWQPTDKGWRLSGDEVHLRLNNMIWPKNAFLVDYQASSQDYKIFVKELLLESLLTAGIQWPSSLQAGLVLHPTGRLHDVQLQVNQGQLISILTGFSELSWLAHQKVPAVQHLSGVFSWQANEGHLALDSKNASIAFQGFPRLFFNELNAGVMWQYLNSGLQIDMDHLFLTYPNLSVQAAGHLANPMDPALAYLQLDAHVVAKEASSWLKLLPPAYLKAKLDDWLKQDISRIEALNARFRVDGLLADFPFDKKPGIFTIDSDLRGVDLSFNKMWPPVKQINAHLQVDKRNLSAEVSHALFRQVVLPSANLRVDNLGLDQEVLLVHGQALVEANALKDYIFASPLETSLGKLKFLELAKPLSFDLNLEAPLYPGRDDILVRGLIGFKDNQVQFRHALNNIVFEQVDGNLQFDEHGVSRSNLSAVLFDEPLNMLIYSTGSPQAATVVDLKTKTRIADLKRRFNAPLLSRMDGDFDVSGQLRLVAKGQDTLQLESSLEAVAIDLPKPLGKKANEARSLSLIFDLNNDRGMHLTMDYKPGVSADLYFDTTKQGLSFDKGDVHFGPGQAAWKKWSGLGVTGSLARLNVDAWRKFGEQFPASASSSMWFERLSFIDMKFKQVHFAGKDYSDVAVKANKLDSKGDSWTFKVDEVHIAGDLAYQKPSNTWSGHLTRVYIDKSVLANQSLKSSLKPLDIPNLNVQVDSVKWGDLDLGAVEIQSTSTAKKWHLERGSISTPVYKVDLKGDWIKDETSNLTQMQARVKMTKLEESLKRWNVTPAVEADDGDVQFDGSWPGAITAFSLANVRGNLYIKLQNGRITHLSPETEEKLGLGKLLSILSLQTIPRRLKLDFSDLSQDGYSFDVFKGHFTLNKGEMNTQDSYLDGPVAYASMKGYFDVVKHFYDLELHISPHITASLPLVVTIAGGPIAGPIAGIATWAASKIIDKGMQQVSGYTYKISGPWIKPIIQQVNIYKKN